MTTPKTYHCHHTGETATQPCCEDCHRVDQYLDLDFNRRLAAMDRRSAGEPYWPHKTQPPDPRDKAAGKWSDTAKQVYVNGCWEWV